MKNQEKVQRELENLRLMEDTLDALISNCAQQLFDITNNLENSAYPFTSAAILFHIPTIILDAVFYEIDEAGVLKLVTVY